MNKNSMEDVGSTTPIFADISCSDKSVEIQEIYVKVRMLTEDHLKYQARWYHSIEILGKATIKIPSESIVCFEDFMNKVFSVKIELEDKNVIVVYDCVSNLCDRISIIDRVSTCFIEFVARSTSPAFGFGFEQLFMQRSKKDNIVKSSISPSKDGKSDCSVVGGKEPFPAYYNDRNKKLLNWFSTWYALHVTDPLDDPSRTCVEEALSNDFDKLSCEDKDLLNEVTRIIRQAKCGTNALLCCERKKPVDFTKKVAPFTSLFSGVTHDWFTPVEGKYGTKQGTVKIINEARNCYIISIVDVVSTGHPMSTHFQFHDEVLHGEDISEKDLPLKINDEVYILEGLVDHIRDGYLTGQRSRIYMVEVKRAGG